ncbi:MAG: TetR family transcriptional regulator [Cupriavidus sp.]|nr:TetR family transcriptional regulator [Cupriavidus sp.]
MARKSAGRPKKDHKHNADTSTRILDAAEALFAEHGFYGVTMRAVAVRAQVDTAMLHYYFQHKKGLFDAVLVRRAEILNQERLEAMNRYASEHVESMTVEGIIEAYLRPLMDPERHEDPGWRNYFALIALVNNTASGGGEMMARYFDPVVTRLIELIHEAMPGVRKEDLYWSYHMLSGSLTLTLSVTGRLDILSGGLCKSSDVASIGPRMVRYCAAGFRELCRPGLPAE